MFMILNNQSNRQTIIMSSCHSLDLIHILTNFSFLFRLQQYKIITKNFKYLYNKLD